MENQNASSSNNCNTSRELGRKSASPYLDHLMSTPVASSKRLRKDNERVNPFERHLLHRLHEPVWSPSVLNYSSDTDTPPARGWEIDHIAKLNPISIEESPSTHQNETVLDPQSEAQVQAAISRFFSTEEPIAPSPISHAVKFHNDNTKGVNTDLSFPSILPPEFEQFLYSFSNSSANSGSTSNYAASRNIFSCIDIEAESNSNGSSQASGSGSGSGQHPQTPNGELNTSVTRRKLDFTFDMDCNEDDSDDCDGNARQRHMSTTDEESDGDQYPITSVILDFEQSNGRTIHSPDEASRAGGSSMREALKDCLGAHAHARCSSGGTSGYISIGRSCGSNCSIVPNCSSPTAMETSFNVTGGASNFTFVRSSCDEELMRTAGDDTETEARLKLLLQSPGATPIRLH